MTEKFNEAPPEEPASDADAADEPERRFTREAAATTA